MGDVDGPTIAEAFYQELTKNATFDMDDIPYALDFAVERFRSLDRHLGPHRWAPFIHIGA